MKVIIILTGQVNNPFFENEIDYIKERFHIAAILSYNESPKAACHVLEQHGVPTEKLHIIPHVSSSIAKFRVNPFKLLSWLFQKEVRTEIKNKCFNGRNKLKRLCNIIQYGGYACLAEKIVNYVYSLSFSPDNFNLCLYSFWMGAEAYALAYLKSKGYFNSAKFICRAHVGDLYEEIEDNDMKYLPFRAFINEHMDRISFISKHGMDYFENKFPEPHNKYLSYLGTRNVRLLKKDFRDKDEVCIASCSHAVQVKRLDLIISALAHLDGLRVRWIHLGGGVLMDPMKESAEQRLAGTTVRWEFMGSVANRQILDTYKKYDVDFLINLSDSEGLPVSIMEAFSMGIPVIARSVGGIREIVSNETGLLLEAQWTDGNFEKIRGFVKRRLDNMDGYVKMSEKSFSVWQKYFNADKNYAEFFASL